MNYKELAKEIDNYIDSFTKKMLEEWEKSYDKMENEMNNDDMYNETQLSNAYERYNRVWEIERDESSTRYGKSLLWDLHMLKAMTEDEFIEEIKTNDEFAEKWGRINE